MKFNKIFAYCLIGLTVGAVTSCKEHQEDVVTSLNLSRTLSPLNIEVEADKESAEIKWDTNSKTSYYNLEVYADDDLNFNPANRVASLCRQVTASELPLTLTGLVFDTKYSIRVQAVKAGEEDKASKWTDYSFSTKALTLLKTVVASNVSTNSVKFEWDVTEVAGRATKIKCGDIVYDLTSTDITNGNATVTGLNAETTYMAQLLNSDNKRLGQRSVTTDVDITGATNVLNAGDDLQAAIDAATDGAIIYLNAGDYPGNKTVDIAGKKLTFKGVKPMDMPTVSYSFRMAKDATNGYCAISMKWLSCKDNSGKSNYFIQLKNTAGDGDGEFDIDIQNCKIDSYTKGFIYQGTVPSSGEGSNVKSINVNNTLIYNTSTGAALVDLRDGCFAQNINFTNSTIYKCVPSGRDLIRVDGDTKGSSAAARPAAVGTLNISIDHCTMAKIVSNGGNYQMFYVRQMPDKISFTNNIVTGFSGKRGFTNGVAVKDAEGTIIDYTSDKSPSLKNNFYYQTKYLIKDESGNDQKPQWFDGGGQELNPKFVDPDDSKGKGNDFTLGNENIIKAGAGDPRWLEAQ